VWLINSGKPDVAEESLAAMLKNGVSGAGRLHAIHNLLWSLVLQRKFDAAIEVGELGLQEFPSDWICAYNLTVASACAGRRKLFQSSARMLRQLGDAPNDEASFRFSLLRFEIPQFAETLGVSAAEVERALGIRDSEVASAHETG
jgi:hypothetical protein